MISDVFFVLTVIYVAYVVYIITDTDKNSATNATASRKVPPLIAAKKSQVPKLEPKTTTKAKKATAQTHQPAATAKVELRTVMMKNPKTGEEAKIASNYRMVKRWVKEAMVEEGLLPKIYKTNEMDEKAKAEVAKALSIIKAMDKYKP